MTKVYIIYGFIVLFLGLVPSATAYFSFISDRHRGRSTYIYPGLLLIFSAIIIIVIINFVEAFAISGEYLEGLDETQLKLFQEFKQIMDFTEYAFMFLCGGVGVNLITNGISLNDREIQSLCINSDALMQIEKTNTKANINIILSSLIVFLLIIVIIKI